MSFSVRPATLSDTRQMAAIAGGATTPQALSDWMDDVSAYAAWHVAEDEAGTLLGFQRIGAGDEIGNGICLIATFLLPGASLVVGTRLFDVTAEAARLLGYEAIDAEVSRGNENAKIYYQSRGFRLVRETVEQIVMRYDLD